MEIREAVEQLEWYFECDDGIAAENKTKRAAIMAISALEKQVGKKPTHEATIYKCLTCPHCKNVIDNFEEAAPGLKTRIMYPYCHYCGQKIDWSE